MPVEVTGELVRVRAAPGPRRLQSRLRRLAGQRRAKHLAQALDDLRLHAN
ncbi:hypothetical protein ACH4KO_08845 [Streptomyces anulatus]